MATRRDSDVSTAHHILSDVKRLERRSGGPATDRHNSMVVPPAVKTTKRDTGQPVRRPADAKTKGTKHR
ncbi:MAG: hypothetical protein ACT6RN_16405 [Agrobacterium sp.]|uniref:hypothetical protein n=1 Tax=Agrobacterium sp. TaxID=361 RepID=UPI004037F478